jgi:transcriptional regulator with XRE-family HTH domain
MMITKAEVRLHNLCEKRGYTELALHYGISKGTLHDLANGRRQPSRAMIARLAPIIRPQWWFELVR